MRKPIDTIQTSIKDSTTKSHFVRLLPHARVPLVCVRVRVIIRKSTRAD